MCYWSLSIKYCVILTFKHPVLLYPLLTHYSHSTHTAYPQSASVQSTSPSAGPQVKGGDTPGEACSACCGMYYTHYIVGCVLILFSLSLSLQPLLVQVLPVVLMDNTPLADWVRNVYLSYREMGDIYVQGKEREDIIAMYVKLL